MTDIDEIGAHELKMFIDNDGQLYERTVIPIRRNLMAKRARGEYLHARAVDAFVYLAEAGAKKYAKEYANGSEWSRIFPPATRRATAEELTASFESMADTGELNHLLLPKYRTTVQERGQDQGARKSRAQLEQEISRATGQSAGRRRAPRRKAS